MKETIATIPLMNAFHADDECPFCYLEREAEQHAISFILGSAYMEDDIRAKNRRHRFLPPPLQDDVQLRQPARQRPDLKHTLKKAEPGARR